MFNPEKITLDFDDKDEGIKALKIFRILKLKGKYRLSSSKRGYHFEINCKKHNRETNLRIRYILGDCSGRMRCDQRRLQNGLKEFAILFDNKNGKKCSNWKVI